MPPYRDAAGEADSAAGRPRGSGVPPAALAPGHSFESANDLPVELPSMGFSRALGPVEDCTQSSGSTTRPRWARHRVRRVRAPSSRRACRNAVLRAISTLPRASTKIPRSVTRTRTRQRSWKTRSPARRPHRAVNGVAGDRERLDAANGLQVTSGLGGAVALHVTPPFVQCFHEPSRPLDACPAVRRGERPVALGPEFPGCKPVHLPHDEVETFDGRIEFWDARTETAWVCEPTSPYHEQPSQTLAALAHAIAGVRALPSSATGDGPAGP